MFFRNFRILLLAIAIVSIAACGGGDSGSGAGESLAKQRDAVDCISIKDRIISNSCNIEVIVRVFAGAQIPITVAADSSISITDSGVTGVISFGACVAPFTPVRKDGGFECL